MSITAGIDIGGTKTQVVFCDQHHTVVAQAQAPTPARQGGSRIVQTACQLVTSLIAETGTTPDRIGVSSAGIVDTNAGTVLTASDSFTDWVGCPIASAISEHFGVPAALENDVNAFVLGEATAGALRGIDDALAIMLGTGVGGALWLEGQLYHGLHDAAGEIGHLPGFGELPCTCGGRGHLETLASGRSIQTRYAERAGRQLDAAHVAQAARSGDAVAQSVFTQAGRGISRAIVITVGLLDINTVLIGGGVADAWDLLEPAIMAGLADDPPVSGRAVSLRTASLGSLGAAIGATCVFVA